MNDLISRQQALKEMWKALYEYEDETEKQFQKSKDLDVRDWIMNDRLWVQNGHNLCVNVLANLPSAQPESHWIPCSEGLPKYPFRVQIQLDNGWIITGYYSEEHWYTVPHSGGFLRNDEVEAWRELPKAYDGGDAK